MITSHILDTSIGKPAAGITAVLFFFNEGNWSELARAETDKDGRISDWLNDEPREGIYKIYFDTKHYFQNYSVNSFYPFIEVAFRIHAKEHYHIPLLISPFGYSTYRGS